MNSHYLDLKRKAIIVKDEGGYHLAEGQMNPCIFDDFIGLIFDCELPPVIWEPFGTHMEHSVFHDIASENEVCLISYNVAPKDKRVTCADATRSAPKVGLGGVVFHPPYFGTTPMSLNDRDISLIEDKDEYVKSLKKVANLAKMWLVDEGGLVCAVGRDYRHDGQRIKLDEWYLDIFDGFSLEDVWTSEPDIALIFRRT